MASTCGMVTVCGGEEWKDSKQVRREYPHNQFLDPGLTKGYLTWNILGSQRVNLHGLSWAHKGLTYMDYPGLTKGYLT